jgi:hypothetical protein
MTHAAWHGQAKSRPSVSAMRPETEVLGIGKVHRKGEVIVLIGAIRARPQR